MMSTDDFAAQHSKRIGTEAEELRSNLSLSDSVMYDALTQTRLAVELSQLHQIYLSQAAEIMAYSLRALRADPVVQTGVVASLLEVDQARPHQAQSHRDLVAEILEKSLLKFEIKEKLLRDMISLKSDLLDAAIVDVFMLLATVLFGPKRVPSA